MVSTSNYNNTFPSAVFQSAFDYEKSQETLTFVDFLPDCQKPGGIFTRAVYDSFKPLIDQANDWLKANPQWEIKTCESVEFKTKTSAIQTNKMVYAEYGDAPISFIRGLRLWIVNKTNDSEKFQQIGYLNVVPQQLKEGGIFSSPIYESLDDMIERYNTMIKTQPIPGRILTIETQQVRMSNANKVNPDKSSWMERRDITINFLFILRIFYEIEDSPSEEIGIQDFTPGLLKEGGIFSRPQYELFSSIVNKASDWCSRQTNIRICNVQSLESKLRRGSVINTKKMYTHTNKEREAYLYFVRILRVTYIKSEFGSSIPKLTHKAFVPVQLTTRGLTIPEFETLQETKRRVSAWIKATGAQIVSVETTLMRFNGIEEENHGTETSFTCNRPSKNLIWVNVIRIYMDKFYPEPPQTALPPVPEIQKKSCAIM